MAKISGGGRKIGRNRDKCAKYRQEHRREKNKIRKWKKLLKGLLDNNETAIELKNKIRKLEEKLVISD